jgi:hypothetical protein
MKSQKTLGGGSLIAIQYGSIGKSKKLKIAGFDLDAALIEPISGKKASSGWKFRHPST